MNYREPSPPKTKPPSGYVGVAHNIVETPKGAAYRVAVCKNAYGDLVFDWRYSSGVKLGFWATFRCGLAHDSWLLAEHRRIKSQQKRDEELAAADKIAEMVGNS